METGEACASPGAVGTRPQAGSSSGSSVLSSTGRMAPHRGAWDTRDGGNKLDGERLLFVL